MLTNKVALVIGGASGIGRASAVALARAGASVVVADVDLPGAHATAADIAAESGRAVSIAADITRDQDMEAAVELAAGRFGGLHISVNVAGGGDRRGPIDALSNSDFDAMIDLNLKGTFRAMRAQLKQMCAHGGGGSIINISSTAGLRGVRDGSLYAAAKHGVLGLTKCAALDYADRRIRINAICPGAIETPQFRRVLSARFPGFHPEEALAQVNARQPLGRIGTPDEVADTVVWLASDAAAFITGQALVVDGGATI